VPAFGVLRFGMCWEYSELVCQKPVPGPRFRRNVTILGPATTIWAARDQIFIEVRPKV
jgi:hypothetical protein